MFVHSLGVHRVTDRGRKKGKDGLVCDQVYFVYFNKDCLCSLTCISSLIDYLGCGYLIFNKHVSYSDLVVFKGSVEDRIYFELDQKGEDNDFVQKEELKISDIQIIQLGSYFQEKAYLFKHTAVTESAALCTPKEIRYFAEDLTGLNALMKVVGQASLDRCDLSQMVLYVSFRIDRDWLEKVVGFGVSMVVSRVAPTTSAYHFAKENNVRLVGFARQRKFTLY